ncbi:MAG: ATP-binding protein [Gemmatimonadota bacterium]
MTRATQRAPADLADRYNRLVELAPDAIIIHDGRRIVLANAAAVTLAGARDAHTLTSQPIERYLNPPYLKAIQSAILGSGLAVDDGPIPDHFRRIDGSLVDVEVTAIPFVDRGRPSVHLIVRDLTERTAARAAAAVAAARLRLLLDQLPALLWTTDQEGRLASVRGTTGFGLRAFLLSDPTMIEAHARGLAGESVTNELQHHDRWYQIRVQPFRSDAGRITGCLGLALDVTARRRDEARLNALEKMKAVVGLAGGVAHEVNNMMTIVLGLGELLLEDRTLGLEPRSMVTEIARAGERAALVSRQLLAYSGGGMQRIEWLLLDTLVEEAAEGIRKVLGPSRGLSLILSCPTGVVIDAGRFKQALTNLASNARDAMPNGGVATLQTELIDLPAGSTDHSGEAIPPGSYAMIRFTDTGHGIDPEAMPHIFEPFFTTKAIGKGTGLGLAAISGILGRSGGFVTAANLPGASFMLYLPSFREAPPKVASGIGILPALPTSGTVLVVDEDASVLAATSRALDREGLMVLRAVGGAAALLVLGHESPPDLVLADLAATSMGGVELAWRIAEHNPTLAVVLLWRGDGGAPVHELPPCARLLKKPLSGPVLASSISAIIAANRLEERRKAGEPGE